MEIADDEVNKILTALNFGMRGDMPPNVRLAGTKGLLNAIEFAHRNFEQERDRTAIMETICASTQCRDSEDVRKTAFECLVTVAEHYYPHLTSYMLKVFELTKAAITKDSPEVGMQAIEFWSTLAEQEDALKMEEEEARE